MMRAYAYGAQQAPCYDCPRRYVGCHSNCADWRKYRADIDALKTKIVREKESERITYEFIRNSAFLLKYRAQAMSKRKRQ